jgi:hypothetical protein
VFDPDEFFEDETQLPLNQLDKLRDIYRASESAKKKYHADLQEFMETYKIRTVNHFQRYRRHICAKVLLEAHLTAEQKRCYLACIRPRVSTEPLVINASDKRVRLQAQHLISRKWTDLVAIAFRKV